MTERKRIQLDAPAQAPTSYLIVLITRQALNQMSFSLQTLTRQIETWASEYDHLDVVLPAVATMVAESFFFLRQPDVALGVHLITLIGCMWVLASRSGADPLLSAFAFLPVFRLVNIGMPVFFDEVVYQIMLIYGSLLPGLYLLLVSQQIERHSYNLRRAVKLLIPSVTLGVLLAELEIMLLGVEPLLQEETMQATVALSIVTFGMVSVAEELLFRGILQRGLRSRIGRGPGIALTALLFGTMQAAPQFGLAIPFGIGVGIIVGYVYDWTGSLTGVCIINGSLNIFVFSGISLFDILVL